VADRYAGAVVRSFHPPQCIGNTLFDRLVFFGHRDSVAIIGYGYRQWHLQHPRGIDGLPKNPLRSAGIANDTVAYFVAFV